MAEPVERHPAFDSMKQSPQGVYFLRQLTDLVGEGFDYFALERLAGAIDVWRIEGERGWGFLVEQRGEPQGDTARTGWGFRLMEPVPETLSVQGAMTAQRSGSPEKQVLIEPVEDRAEILFLPRRSSAPVLGLSAETIAELAERHPVTAHWRKRQGETLRDRVQRLLLTIAERVEIDRNDDLSIPYGTTRVFVRVIERESGDVVNVWAVTNLSVPPTPEFFQYIATKSDAWWFGHLSANVHQDGTAWVTFSHRLFADFLVDAELVTTVRLIGGTGDGIDEEIQQRFGGSVFHAPPAPADVPARPEDPPTGMYL